jgi:hypothetical protein
MPKTGLKQSFNLTTRNQYTKINAEIGFTVEGNELPNMAVLGNALEKAIALIQKDVTESYVRVPERI